jgi:hypothetical protein
VPVIFLNPWAAVLFLFLAAPLAGFARLREHDRAVREVLLLPDAARRTLVAPLAAAIVTGALLTLAATQPALVRSSTRLERTDAEALFVLDISRSMLAAQSSSSATRLARAKAIASQLRGRLPTVPAGIASVTDRVLPYLLPTTDERVFRSTLRDAVAIDEPPPTNVYYDRATALGALAEIPARRFFSARATKRLLVVLTDGESRAVALPQAERLRRAGLRTVFVHVWNPGEEVYATGRPEKTYRADPESAQLLDGLARLSGGTTLSEAEEEGLIEAARAAIGRGRVRHVRDHRYVALMRPIVLVALLPLVFLLWQRNGWALSRALRTAIERRKRWLASRQHLQHSPASPHLRP